MRSLVPSLASFALLPLLVAAVPASAATGTALIVQQRLSDGRLLLTDNPVRGATTERSWVMRTEDPAVAQRRAAEVSAEAQQVSERIQRMLDEQRRADEESARTRVAALAMERQAQRSEEAVYLGGVVPYGAYGYGFGGIDRHRHGKPGRGDRFDKGHPSGRLGSFTSGHRPSPTPWARTARPMLAR